ncbi:MAG: histone deacetylase [Verrucomicrobia bacterium]|nr:histone deacetylase [Verrucomicrobiota bacterium]
MTTPTESDSLLTGLVADERYQLHVPGAGHPECPARYRAALSGIAAAVPGHRLRRIDPRLATTADLLRCHTPGYVAQVEREIASGVRTLSTGDTHVCRDSQGAALLASGGVLAATDAVMTGQVKNAFCAVRPPGHHATPAQGMGFCIYNHVAVAARYVQRQYGVERVLIVDWDVHHGNGTQDIFYDDASVFYFSTHQWPLYPGTGARAEVGTGAGRGFTRNVPVPAGTTGEGLRRAFMDELMPAMVSFKPELILISAGFDARKDEPISDLSLTDDDFGMLTRMVVDLANDHANGRIVSSLEGGYGLEGLASAVGAHVAALAKA